YNPADLSFKSIPYENREDKHRNKKLWIDSKGNVFLILDRHRILHYDKVKKVFTETNSPIRQPAGYKINSVYEDVSTGYYWLTCLEGLAVYDSKRDQIYTMDHNPLNLPNLSNPEYTTNTIYLIDSQRNHWLIYWHPDQKFIIYNEKLGLYSKDGATLENQGYDYRQINGVLETNSGEIWYYGVNSLYCYNSQSRTFEFLRNEYLRHKEIYQIYEDREGSLWLASDEGIYYYTDNSPDISYTFFTEKNPNHIFLDIKEIKIKKNGKVNYWIASWGRGTLILDENLKEIPNTSLYENIDKNPEILQPWAIAQHKETGLVWVGGQRGWLQIADPNTFKNNFYNFPIFGNSTIRTISEDSKGNLWFTTHKGDLIKYYAGKPIVNESFEMVNLLHALPYAALVDQNNRIWICTSGKGIICLDLNTGKEIFQLDDSKLSSNRQEKIAQLNDSIFFFGYDLLNAYNAKSGTNRILSYSDGLISNDILNMQVDMDGYLWIFTTKGICRYNYYQNSFTHYGQKDGFGLLEMDGYGGTLTEDGRIFFTGYSSLVAFNPTQFNSSIKPDRPTLTSIKLFDNYLFVDSLNTQDKRTFSHDKNSLTFYFSTLNFINQDKLKYFYKLSGIDPVWRYGGQSNIAVYTLLPAGNYTLEFRSENEEGISSPVGSFIFQINPPYYETWWFRMTIALIVLIILVIMYRLRINRILAVMNVRNRVARDLHDDMGSTLSTINILSAMAKTKLNVDPVKTSEYISKISDNSQRMMEAMDDIVWSIKPQNDSMDKIIARMREFATNALEAKDIEFSFEIDEEVYKIKLPMDSRRDLFLIFKEAVNNLAKYSNTNKAVIQFTMKNGKLLMNVRDYGLGFDLGHADTGNGLSNMQKRAQNMKAKLNIISKHMEGTDVMLAVDI
ncbi:MAG TPA: two-component regulator propeller domain-containing protein, partial [Anditalea sp.]|nr:two-component regulator propeller domain-containing protein [Anditalea sp.]